MAKSSFTLDLFGDKELVNALKAGEEDTPQAIAQAIYEEANVIFAKSQVLVPVDTGVLRGSGGVSAFSLLICSLMSSILLGFFSSRFTS